MIEPYEGRVYDPCCGSGGMFVQSEKFVESHGGQRRDISIYGQESNPNTWRLAHMNLAIRGIEANLGQQPSDSFVRDLHPDLKADYVVAIAKVEALEVFERIADGLDMPDPARAALGLAPKAGSAMGRPAGQAELGIPSRDTSAALPAAAVFGLLSADIGISEEDEPSVQRRTFVSLTGTSLFGALLADTRSPADAIESFAAVLATYASDPASPALDALPTCRR